MTLTEAEAKTKWCPFSRVIAGNLVDQRMYVQVSTQPHNRVQEDGGEGEATTHAAMNCLGAGCMAWHWYDNSFRWDGPGPRPPTEPGKPSTGFCGLAEPSVTIQS